MKKKRGHSAFLAACLLAPWTPATAQDSILDFPDVGLPQNTGYERNAPEELVPATVEPGLTSRAIPALPDTPQPQKMMPIYRLYYLSDILKVRPPEFRPASDPSSFRPVTTNKPPIGLMPQIYRKGVFEFYPSFGLAQSFDSNVNLTPNDEIADFYLTPKVGLEFQLGTPDSVNNEFYDTILALHGTYEGWADLYYANPDLSAFNQTLELSGRIGRASAIWRPYFLYSDVTGSNVLMADLVNRTKRIRIMPALFAEYQFTSKLGMNQTFSGYSFEHPNPAYINLLVARTRQEITYRVLDNVRASVWAEYRHTQPDRGFAGNETMIGVGWMGKPDSRIYTEFRIGWDILDMDGDVPGRRNLSGIVFSGYTTFDWGPRFRLTILYDRDYVFNEIEENDNYTSTLLQTRGEFYLGGNWYITPYFGFAIQDFETSRQVVIQYRPELEVSYALPSDSVPNASRIYTKVAYMKSETIRGSGLPIEDFRLSIGMNWQF